MSTETKTMTERHTLVEEGTEFKGSLSSKCLVVVKGKVEGDVNAPAMAVSESGSVQGQVKVQDLRSQGELAGELHADTMHLSGVVKDNTILRAKSLEVRLESDGGGLVFGECTLEVGDPNAMREQGVSKPKTASVTPSAPTATAAEAPAPAKGKDGKKKDKRAPNDDIAAAMAAVSELPGGILTEAKPDAPAASPDAPADGAAPAPRLSQPPPS